MEKRRRDSMTTQTLTVTATAALVFPAAEVKRCLREELQKIADDGSVLRPEWEPLLDSKRVVGTVLGIEDLFPFKLPRTRWSVRAGTTAWTRQSMTCSAGSTRF